LTRTSFSYEGQAARNAPFFIQNGDNLVLLQRSMGRSRLAMTMRYAHLAPDHLQDALRFGSSFS
jgi:site-specific recombinase XerD